MIKGPNSLSSKGLARSLYHGNRTVTEGDLNSKICYIRLEEEFYSKCKQKNITNHFIGRQWEKLARQRALVAASKDFKSAEDGHSAQP